MIATEQWLSGSILVRDLRWHPELKIQNLRRHPRGERLESTDLAVDIRIGLKLSPIFSSQGGKQGVGLYRNKTYKQVLLND